LATLRVRHRSVNQRLLDVMEQGVDKARNLRAGWRLMRQSKLAS
jgi:hypothetical protein